MQLKHALILVLGAGLTVLGIYLELDGHTGGGFVKGIGIGGLLAFVYIFYKYLKTKNETTSK